MMDAPGIREELRNMTRRIARQGYFAILPDMYYRLGTLRFDIARRDDKMATVFLGAMNSLTNAMVAVGISVVPYYARVTYAVVLAERQKYNLQPGEQGTPEQEAAIKWHRVQVSSVQVPGWGFVTSISMT